MLKPYLWEGKFGMIPCARRFGSICQNYKCLFYFARLFNFSTVSYRNTCSYEVMYMQGYSLQHYLKYHKIRHNPKCPTIENWLKKLYHIYPVESPRYTLTWMKAMRRPLCTLCYVEDVELTSVLILVCICINTNIGNIKKHTQGDNHISLILRYPFFSHLDICEIGTYLPLYGILEYN